MSADIQELKSRLNQLDANDRAELDRYLIQTLGPNADEEIARAWERELDRRLEEMRSGEVVGIPAREDMAHLREKYS